MKAETELTHVRPRTHSPSVKLSCCEKVGQCCNKYCCDCRNKCCDWCKKCFGCLKKPKKQVYSEPERTIKTFSDQKAERKILIKIEFIPYSNINSPSLIKVLPTNDQYDFYKKYFSPDILEFYLGGNIFDFKATDFDFKRMKALALCRVVTHLKSMVDHYPDEETLEMIVKNEDILTIGDPPKENIERNIVSDGTTSIFDISASIPGTSNRF